MIPLILYMIERLSRYLGTAGKPLSITKVKEHPNDVIEIEFFDPNFKAKPGQVSLLKFYYKHLTYIVRFPIYIIGRDLMSQ